MSVELVFYSIEDATDVASKLLKNGYVTMLSAEGDFYVVNAIWSANDADRNDVVFMSREEFDEEYTAIVPDEDDDAMEDNADDYPQG